MKSLKLLSFIAIMLVSTFAFAADDECSESKLASCKSEDACKKLNTGVKIFAYGGDPKKCILTECKDGLVVKDNACAPDICSNKETSSRSAESKTSPKDSTTTGGVVTPH
jgi:hypothetical protein